MTQEEIANRKAEQGNRTRLEALLTSGYLVALFGVISIASIGFPSPIPSQQGMFNIEFAFSMLGLMLSLMFGFWRVSLTIISYWWFAFDMFVDPTSLLFSSFWRFCGIVIPTFLAYEAYKSWNCEPHRSKFSIASLVWLTLVCGIVAAVSRKTKDPIVSIYVAGLIANGILFFRTLVYRSASQPIP